MIIIERGKINLTREYRYSLFEEKKKRWLAHCKLMHLEKMCCYKDVCSKYIHFTTLNFNDLETNGHSPPMTYRECQQ